MSNRADFLEIREREAFENPQDYERPDERKPEMSALEKRANAYLGAIERNRLKVSINHAINHPESINKESSDLSDIDFNAKFIGPKMLTDFQKLHFIPETSEKVKRENLKSLEDGFKKLRKKS